MAPDAARCARCGDEVCPSFLLCFMELLVVEDDPRLGKAVTRYLAEGGHACTLVKNGLRGLELARTQQFDAIVLDLLLPDMHGLSLLHALRDEGIQTPVLVLSALGTVDDRVKGFDRGADDYLVKPFALPELLARLQALCRRAGVRPVLCYEVGPLKLNLSTRKVTRGKRDIDLSPTEFSILECLMRHHGNVVTRKMLNEHLWGEDWSGMTNVLDVHINHLRRKVDRDEEPLIHTVRGRGYVLRAT